MRQISSIMHPRHDDYFEDISHIAEKSSNSGSPCRAPKNAIEENCLWQDISSTKNLEFDTVIMPAMNNGLEPWEDTKILVNEKKVGWIYKRPLGNSLSSMWYKELRDEDVQKGDKEETRILYVAMTRAVNKLVLLVNNWNYESWSSLIRKVGLTNE